MATPATAETVSVPDNTPDPVNLAIVMLPVYVSSKVLSGLKARTVNEAKFTPTFPVAGTPANAR